MEDTRNHDSDEKLFERLLHPHLEELRRTRGTCLSAEELVAFSVGALPPARIVNVREHVEVCGLCDLLLSRLDKQEKHQTSVGAAIWRVLRNPLVPYTAVVGLSISLYCNLARLTEPSEPSKLPQPAQTQPLDANVSIPRASLEAVRSGSSNLNSSAIQLSNNDRFFLISFFIPVRSTPTHRYESTIHTQSREVVEHAPLNTCDVMGNCLLLLSTARFLSGVYDLSVTEIGPGNHLKIYSFRFQVRR